MRPSPLIPSVTERIARLLLPMCRIVYGALGFDRFVSSASGYAWATNEVSPMLRKLFNLGSSLLILAVFPVFLVNYPRIASGQSSVSQPPVTNTHPSVVSDTNLAVPSQDGREGPINSTLLKKFEPLLLLLLGLFLFLAATGIKQRQARAKTASGSVPERQFATLASSSSGQPGKRPMV